MKVEFALILSLLTLEYASSVHLIISASTLLLISIAPNELFVTIAYGTFFVLGFRDCRRKVCINTSSAV
jgi:hypothetical protein